VTEPLKTVLDWEVGQEEFRQQIREMVSTCAREGRVIPLPLRLVQGIELTGQLGFLLTMVNCDQCNALCCTRESSPDGEGIGLIGPEVEFVQRAGYAHCIQENSLGKCLPYPCPFYSAKHNGRGCSIYPDRPFACVLYPFQPGGWLGEEGVLAISVAASCPEGRRIARSVYMHTWRVRQKFMGMKEVIAHE